MTNNREIIIKVVSQKLIPLILLFALYVQFHGDFGPGGGFQAGVIFAAGIILYTIIFGIKKAQKDFPETIFNYMVPLGVLIFTVTGLISLSKGFNFLDYDALAHYPKHGQHIGIIAIELGVFVTVIGSMVSIFYAFVARGKK